MSTTATHANPDLGASETSNRTRLLRWIAGGAAGATILAVVAIAAWPASETDKARADGKEYGKAVGALYDAQTPAEVDAALADVHKAASDTRTDAGEFVADHVAAQQDALARAADGFVGAHTAGDGFELDLYQAELDYALDDLNARADSFRAQGPEVQQAFWDGYREGLPIAT